MNLKNKDIENVIEKIMLREKVQNLLFCREIQYFSYFESKISLIGSSAIHIVTIYFNTNLLKAT